MKKYRVTATNCRGYKLGETIELSDSEAKNLVNKIELVMEAEKPELKPAAKPKAKRQPKSITGLTE